MDTERTNQRWEELARTDPLWGVVSDPARRGNRWDPESFYASGRETVRHTLQRLEDLGLGPVHGPALDFGCGVGRLTWALADHVSEVHGVDASPTMVRLARKHRPDDPRVKFHVVRRPPLPFPGGFFAFILSELTLQHIPPPAARRVIREFLRVLAPDGILVFQEAADPLLPGDGHTLSRRLIHRFKLMLPRPVFDLLRSAHLALRPPETFEMHGVPRATVEAIVRRGGGRLVHVEENRSAGPGWTSYRYFVAGPARDLTGRA